MGFYLEKKPEVLSRINLVKKRVGKISRRMNTVLYNSIYTQRFTKKFHTTISYSSGVKDSNMMKFYL